MRTKQVTLPGDVILFDCDGVLVDSDASVVQAWSRWATKYSLEWDRGRWRPTRTW